MKDIEKKFKEFESSFDRLLRLIKKNLGEEKGLPSYTIKEAIDNVLNFDFPGIKKELNWSEFKRLFKNMIELSGLIARYKEGMNGRRQHRYDKKSIETRYRVAVEFLARDIEEINWKYLKTPVRQNPEYLKFLELMVRMMAVLEPPPPSPPITTSKHGIESGFISFIRKTVFFVTWMAAWLSGLLLFTLAGKVSFFRTSGVLKTIIVIGSIVFVGGWFWFSGKLLEFVWKPLGKLIKSFSHSLGKTIVRITRECRDLLFRVPVTFNELPIKENSAAVILEPSKPFIRYPGLPRDSFGFRIGQKLDISQYQVIEGGEETGLTFYRVFREGNVQVDCGVTSVGYILHIRVSYNNFSEVDQEKFLADFNKQFKKYQVESKVDFLRKYVYVDQLTEVSLLLIQAAGLCILNIINIIEAGSVPRFICGYTLGDLFIPLKGKYEIGKEMSLNSYRFFDGAAMVRIGVNWRNRIKFLIWKVEGIDASGAARLTRYINDLCGEFLRRNPRQEKPGLSLGLFFIHEFRDKKTSLKILFDRGLLLMHYEDLK